MYVYIIKQQAITPAFQFTVLEYILDLMYPEEGCLNNMTHNTPIPPLKEHVPSALRCNT